MNLEMFKVLNLYFEYYPGLYMKYGTKVPVRKGSLELRALARLIRDQNPG